MLERRLPNQARQLRLATRLDGTVHGGPDRFPCSQPLQRASAHR
jgi:hypothetical protein